LNEEPEGEAKL